MTQTLAESIRQLMASGRTDVAERELRTRLEQSPDAYELHLLLSHVAGARGDTDEALGHALRARTLAPASIEVQFAAACLLAHAGRYSEAVASFRHVVGRQPERGDAWRLLALALLQAHPGDATPALGALRRAHRLSPSSKTLRLLADAEFDAGFPEDALPLWRQIHEAEPRDAQATLRYGETLNRLGEQQSTVALLRASVAERPHDAELWTALGQTYEDRGDPAQARECYEQAATLKPDWAFPLGGLLGVMRGDTPAQQVAKAMALMERPELPDAERALLGYELGKALDAQGRYDAAMASWDAANMARRRQIGTGSLSEFEAPLGRARRVFTTEVLDRYASLGSQDERFVFIVGMPRSGTTLTEQIIASHPRAHGGGELAHLPLIVRTFPYLEDGRHRSWDEMIHADPPTWLQAAIERYTRGALRHSPAGAIRVIDKAPLNFFNLGLIALMFPHAKVIWCRRDPRDLALSIYGENFALEERLATDLASIGRYILLQEEVMRHWQSLLPDRILESSYEQLANDLEGNARRLVGFCGLEWSDECLDFHRNDRGVQTPSRWQVKQPIHTRSIGRWRHYQAHMGPLLQVLEADGAWSATPHPSKPSG